MKFKRSSIVMACLMATVAGSAMASSHREAPFITTSPKVDGTDFYMFSSYETGRKDYVTLIANYQPLQHPYGGPNYFSMDPNALYEIHIDNNGDAKEDITFQFRFKNDLNSHDLKIGDSTVASPLIQSGRILGSGDGVSLANRRLTETYSVNVVRGDRRKGDSKAITKEGGGATFDKPADYIGQKTMGTAAEYKAYAENSKHMPNINIPGCAMPGKVFVGQRQEGFAVNLGRVFDLVNASPTVLTSAAAVDAEGDDGNHFIQKTNVTSIALEIHKSCLTSGNDPVIGGWTTASMRQARLLNGKPASGHQTSEKAGGAWVQVSRLGNPLVNELVIGLKDKDKFNASKPQDDAANFLTYVTNPTLPALLTTVLGTDVAPTNLPRTDLATVFLTGITDVNLPKNIKPSEMLRLNTDVSPTAEASQNRLGVAGEVIKAGGKANLTASNDLAGFPNGRRPKDDVVDIALIAVTGGLCAINSLGTANSLGFNSVPGVPALTSACDNNSIPKDYNPASIHDAVDQAKVKFLPGFPYLNTPNPGSVNLKN